jgi:hypothetical protein
MPEIVKTMVSIPADIRSWVETEAAKEDRTLSSTITRTLRAEMKRSAARERRKPGRADE